MRWERVYLNIRPRETSEGKKTPGRIGGILGPGRRWGHTCNAVKGGRFLYVFGGYGKDNAQTNDVYVYDTYRQAWSRPVVKGNPPSPRDSHSCTTVGNNLYVFGGTDGRSPLKDLHILDTSTNTWIVPSISGEGPEAREGHSAALVGKQLYIFGGCGKSPEEPEEVYFNDLYILDTERFIWKHALTSGTPPSARDSHTCSSWKNNIIIIGGEDASDYYLSDVHILDVETLVWRELNTTGQILAPRAGHSTVALGNYLFVFGGFTDDRNLYDDLHVLNVETGVWNKISASGGPSARFSVAGDCLDPRRGILVFIGGCSQNLEALDDFYYLHTDMSSGNGKEERKQEKFSLRKELKRKCQEQQHHAPVDRIESGPSQPMPLPTNSQASRQRLPVGPSHEPTCSGVKTFEARVTNIINHGVTIETMIDGKPLRGILFSCNSNVGEASFPFVSRGGRGNETQIVGDVGGRSEQGQADGQGRESTSQDSQMETIGSDSNNSGPTDGSHQQMVQEDAQTPGPPGNPSAPAVDLDPSSSKQA